MADRLHEQAKFWRAKEFDNLELLHATYITHTFDKHFHDEYVVGVVVRSEYAFFCQHETVLAGKGQIILINPGEIHSGYAVNEAGWTYRALYPSVHLMKQIAEEITGQQWDMPHFPYPLVDDLHTAGLLVDLHRALENSTLQLERDTLLRTGLGTLIARHAKNRPLELPPLGNEREAITQVRDFLETHYMENPSLEQLAQLAGLSPYHLVRVFKQQTGLPPHTYLVQVRVEQAKRVLQTGSSIAEVAAATGFADQSHLTRRFKRIVGVTPGQFVLSNP